MDLAIHFPCAYPLVKQGYSRAHHLPIRAFNGDRRSWPREKASSSSSSSMGRSKKGSVCSAKPSDERSSSTSKLKQEEIISLFRRIQSSISKGESQGDEEKSQNRDGSSEREPLSKAVLEVLEKSRKKTDAVRDTGVKEEPPKRQGQLARPPSSFAKRSPISPSATGPRGKLPITKRDIALEETEKEETPPLIETMKLAELKEVAKSRGIKGYSKLKKSQILELLRPS